MNAQQPSFSTLATAAASRPVRRAARFAHGGAIKVRFGGRMMLLVWRKRARSALLLVRLLKRSLLPLAGVAAAVLMHDAASAALVSRPPINAGAQTAFLPVNGQVAAGHAFADPITPTSQTLVIHQTTPQAIVNWDSFNIGSGYKVNFVQPDSTSSILNRVNSGAPVSSILGSLSANGKVWLINPAGIMIGKDAKIDVAGFVASSLKVSDKDFLANNLNFTDGANAGSAINYGQITAPIGGNVYLIGAIVENYGTIRTSQGEVGLPTDDIGTDANSRNKNAKPRGKSAVAFQNDSGVDESIAALPAGIVLAAGDTVTVTLADTTLPGLQVQVSGSAGSVRNLGTIINQAGQIGLAGALVTNAGALDVSSVTSQGGRIFLQASSSGTLATGSDIVTGTGGTVTLASPEPFSNDGKIELGAASTLTANNNLINAQGGTISGFGTLALGSHTLINNGVVAPGTSADIGTLTIDGRYTQGSTGELRMKVFGAAAGQYDRLVVNGATTLGGTLTVDSASSYVAAPGDAFSLITGMYSPSTLGTFSSVVAPAYLSVGYGLYSDTPVRVNYVSGGTDFFKNSTGDLNWNNDANWSTGYKPVAVSDVLIDSGATIQHSSGIDTVRSLIVNNNNGLNISGGSLTVNTYATIGGTLTVGAAGMATLSGGLTGVGTLAIDGGTVQLGAASTIANLAMSGGTLAGTSNFSVTNSFQQTGGAIQFAGAAVSARQVSGDLMIASLSASSADLSAGSGAIVQNGGTLSLGTLITQSLTGTTLASTSNLIGGLSASNSGTGNITVNSAESLVLGSVSNTGAAINLTSGGTLTETGTITGNALATTSVGGTTLNGANQIASFAAANTGRGDISLVNTTRPAKLTVLDVTNTAGSVTIDNTGGIITAGNVNAMKGDLTITAHSPITVSAGSTLSAQGDITLDAVSSVQGGDNVSVSGTLVSATGKILVAAGSDMPVNSTATMQVTPGSFIGLAAPNGTVDIITGARFIGADPTITQKAVAAMPLSTPTITPSQTPVVPGPTIDVVTPPPVIVMTSVAQTSPPLAAIPPTMTSPTVNPPTLMTPMPVAQTSTPSNVTPTTVTTPPPVTVTTSVAQTSPPPEANPPTMTSPTATPPTLMPPIPVAPTSTPSNVSPPTVIAPTSAPPTQTAQLPPEAPTQPSQTAVQDQPHSPQLTNLDGIDSLQKSLLSSIFLARLGSGDVSLDADNVTSGDGLKEKSPTSGKSLPVCN